LIVATIYPVMHKLVALLQEIGLTLAIPQQTLIPMGMAPNEAYAKQMAALQIVAADAFKRQQQFNR